MKKVKKFGRGGDVLTALGAGLAGYGIYKALNKDKDKDDSSGASLKKPKISEEVEKAQDSSKAAERKADERKAKNGSSYAPENKFDVAKQTGFTGDGKDDKTKPLPTVIKNKKTEPPSKPYPKVTRNFVPNEERASIPYPEKEAADALGKKDLKPFPDKKPAAKKKPGDVTFLTKKRSDAAKESVSRARREQMSRLFSGKKVEEPKRNTKPKRTRYAKKQVTDKKYASGGSVSSASKRADGIAIRGKTRA